MEENDEVPTVEILGVPVSTLGLEESASTIVEWGCASGPAAPRCVHATSVHGVIEARDHALFRSILARADMVTADGMPLVWAGRSCGASRMERVYGPDLLERVCRQAARRPIRHYFYGGAPGVPEELARRLAAEFPGLSVAGTYSPPFRELTPEERAQVAEAINASGAQLLWVGLSTPKQEYWVESIRELLKVRVVITVGAAFDFHTGRVPQAPRWMQRSGLEWLFRLIQEPRRLWRRYAYNNPRFLLLLLREVLRSAPRR